MDILSSRQRIHPEEKTAAMFLFHSLAMSYDDAIFEPLIVGEGQEEVTDDVGGVELLQKDGAASADAEMLLLGHGDVEK